MRNICIVSLSVLALAAIFPSSVTAQNAPGATTYIILARTQGAASTGFAAAIGSAVVANYPEIGVVVAESSDPSFPSWAALQPGVAQIAADVEFRLPPGTMGADALGGARVAGPNFVANSGYRFPIQWNLRQIHADETAAAGYTGSNTITGIRARVAVLDSGIIKDNPDIAPNLNVGCSTSFVPGEPDLEPPAYVESHGTAVAAMVAGAGVEVQGVAPEAEIVAIKVLSGQTTTGKYSWILKGLYYAINNDPAHCHPDVINMSIGGEGDTLVRNTQKPGFGTLVAALNRAVTYARRQGILVVSCAGNDGLDLNSIYWILPAQAANGMAVSATGPYGWADANSQLHNVFDRPASYTNYGQSVINVAGPGGDFQYPPGQSCTVAPFTRDCSLLDSIIAPYYYEDSGNGIRTHRYGYWYGTSMAAPHVAGLAALLVGRYGHVGPASLQMLIERSADDVFKPGADPYSGRGRINAGKAVLP